MTRKEKKIKYEMFRYYKYCLFALQQFMTDKQYESINKKLFEIMEERKDD